MSDLFIFAGEPSGDLHGANLLKELKELRSGLDIQGVPGPKMRAVGVKAILKMEEFQVMGFTDVFKSLPDLTKKFFLVRDHILQTKPKGVLLIDYPGFNLRLAKSLRKKGYTGKIIHYICPSVWAWGKNRVQTISENVDRLLTIYPFEAKYFLETKLDVEYIGNPLVETIQSHPFRSDWRQVAGLPPKTERLIGVFPGSRVKEIERNAPVILKALKLLKDKLPNSQFALSVTSPKLQPLLTTLIAESQLKLNSDLFLIPSSFNYELMQDLDLAIAKSGTVTLELALFKCPTVVVYGLSTLNWLIAKYLFRLNLPYYCIVNILKNKLVFPEIIERGFNPEHIADTAYQLETTPFWKAQCIKDCEEIERSLSGSSSSRQAALSVEELILR